MIVQQEVFEFSWKNGSVLEASAFLLDLCTAIGFKPVAVHCQLFPTPDNRGGDGMTAFVSFVESYMALDVWPEHEYAHLTITSCRAFDAGKIRAYLGNSLR